MRADRCEAIDACVCSAVKVGSCASSFCSTSWRCAKSSSSSEDAACIFCSVVSQSIFAQPKARLTIFRYIAQSASSAPNISSARAKRHSSIEVNGWCMKQCTAPSLSALLSLLVLSRQAGNVFHPRLRGRTLSIRQVDAPPRSIFQFSQETLLTVGMSKT